MTMTRVAKQTMAVVTVAFFAVAQPLAAAADTVSRVRAFQTDCWNVWVSAGSHRIVVNGDGDTDLDLYVYDSVGRLLAVDDDDTDYCVGTFYMPRGGYVRIQIRNLGRVYNEYELSIR